jgi:small subunit ribosomal protein S16
MLKIRMQRVGRINQPAYRIVVIEHTSSTKAGKFVEKVGTYNPRTKARTLDEARVKYWMSVGAQPSATMHNMLVGAGVLSGKKINVLPAYKAPEVAAVAEAPAEAAPEAEVAETPAETPEEGPAAEGEAKAE